MKEPSIRVLGPIEASIDGLPLPLTKSRHRELLALLVAGRGRVLSTTALVDELWDEPRTGAIGALRTFVGELRRILEPDRPPRTPPKVVVTVGDGYALRAAPDGVDLWRVERAVHSAAELSPENADAVLSEALDEWRGTAFQEFLGRPWAESESSRVAALRTDAVERLAGVRLALGRPTEAVALLDEHVVAHPWREGAWSLLALALYRSERRSDALSVLRRARARLTDDNGLDPGRRLAELERSILRGDPALDLPDRNESILLRAAFAHARTGARTQLESASALLPALAVSGGLSSAAEQRLAAIAAADELGDAELVARVIGSFDVPGSWTRSDDPQQSSAVVDAALRALSALSPGGSERTRARLLATVAMESRGVATCGAEAREAEAIARRLGDPALLCFALSALYLQRFESAGLAAARESIGAELIATARAAELPTFEIHGHLIRMQALCALDDVRSAADEADAVDALADRHERPLATVFTAWFRWTFIGATVVPPAGTEMAGFANGIAALSRLTSALRVGAELPDGDFGPYEPWVRPLLLTRSAHPLEAASALDVLPDPPADLLLEATWVLVGRAALEVGHASAAQRAFTALRPASAERAAGSAVIDLGPVAPIVAELERLLG
jgi:DNA-binding SARP family transcriptional activator